MAITLKSAVETNLTSWIVIMTKCTFIMSVIALVYIIIGRVFLLGKESLLNCISKSPSVKRYENIMHFKIPAKIFVLILKFYLALYFIASKNKETEI